MIDLLADKVLYKGNIHILRLCMDYKELGRKVLYFLFDPLVHGIKAMGIKPNHITFLGFALNILAIMHLLNYGDCAGMSYGDNLIGFGLLLGVGGLMDTLDGRLARLYDLKSRFGAYFDSVVDRYSEFIMFLGIILYFYRFDHIEGVIFSIVALMGSVMVSYNRSRAEAFGVDCDMGLMQRPERIVFIVLWAIIWGVIYTRSKAYFTVEWMGIDIFALGFLFLAITTNITALRRMWYASNMLKQSNT